jgi:hypothetical protein
MIRLSLPDGSWTPVLAVKRRGDAEVLRGSRVELTIEELHRLAHLASDLAEAATERRAEWELDRAIGQDAA